MIYFAIVACNPNDPTPVVTCDQNNTLFNQLYQSVLSNPSNVERVFMDREVHSYTFEVLSNKTICKVGYQSFPDISTIPYLIEIVDNTSNTIIYSGSHVFSSSATSYVSINPISIVVGRSYTIKRVQTNWAPYITNTIGRMVHNQALSSNLVFPFIVGDLKITGSVLSDYNPINGAQNDMCLPYIDIVFQ